MRCPPVVSLKKQKALSDNRVRVASPAKLNLHLAILGKRPDGYHEIESVVERISLFDYVDITRTRGSAITFSCNVPALENSDNLCVRAARLVQSACRLQPGFSITLRKKIPVGSGMGGGSSNAAAVICGINALCGLGLSETDAYKLGAQLGSDVNFFLSGASFALMRGRGESIEPLSGKCLRHTVIWPGGALSTARVYKNMNAKLTKYLSNVNILRHALEKGDTRLLQIAVSNALEPAALALSGRLARAKRFFDNQGWCTRVTGSGSAFFTIGKHTHVPIHAYPAGCLRFSVETI